METLPEIQALLDEPRFNWSDTAPWIELEQELVIEFPADFREIVNAYGSIEINGQFTHLTHIDAARAVYDARPDTPPA